jgi:sortase A
VTLSRDAGTGAAASLVDLADTEVGANRISAGSKPVRRARLPSPRRAGSRPSGSAGRNAWSGLLGTWLLILAGLLLGFVLCLTVLGGMHYQRAQSVGYSDFRQQLALAEAPVSQRDYDGRPVVLGAPVAVLSIPALHLRVLVRDGTTAGVLTDGPGLERDSVIPGQVGTSVVFGRRWAFGGPFGGLGRLKPGDEITVTTGEGATKLRVVDVRLPGDRVPVLSTGKGRLVLTTAGGSPWLPTTVVRVDADTVSAGRPAGPVLATARLTAAEGPMATDTSAWVPVLLWFGLLLLVAGMITWLRRRWTGPHLWAVAVPVVLLVGVELGNEAARLLPNLM